MNNFSPKKLFYILAVVLGGLVAIVIVDCLHLKHQISKERTVLNDLEDEHDKTMSELTDLDNSLNEAHRQDSLRNEEKYRLKFSTFLEATSDKSYSFRGDIASRLKSLGFTAGPTKLLKEEYDYDYYSVYRTIFTRTRNGKETQVTVIDYDLMDGDYSNDIMIDFDSEASKQDFIDNALEQPYVTRDGTLIEVKLKYGGSLCIDTAPAFKIRIYSTNDDSYLPRFLK